jgi:enterochelin esterase-like enzyme
MRQALIAAAACLTLVTAATAQDEGTTPLPRTIHSVTFMSEALGTVRTFGLLLPPDYNQSTRRYPVLYLLHGSGQQHATWGRQTLRSGATGMIVVMPDNDRARYAAADGTVDARYDTFVASELIDYVDAHYRTVATREGRAIGGLSIGGFGAMLLGLKHADRFAAIGAFSAPYDTRTFAPLLNSTPTPPAIFLGCGTADSLLPANRRFAMLLEAQHIARRYVEVPGAHDWNAWDPLLAEFLSMLKAARFSS